MEFSVRELEEKDLENGFLEIINSFRPIGNLKNERIKEILKEIKGNTNHKIFVAVNDESKIVGTTTLFIEQKFYHEGGLAAHIEDVVTHEDFRKMGVGSALLKQAIEAAKSAGCYKVILDCSEENSTFYERVGFKKHGVEMRMSLE